MVHFFVLQFCFVFCHHTFTPHGGTRVLHLGVLFVTQGDEGREENKSDPIFHTGQLENTSYFLLALAINNAFVFSSLPHIQFNLW